MADLKQNGICKLSIEVVRDRQTPDDLNSLLASYILDEGLLARVIHACHCCTCTKDVCDKVYFLLRQSAIWNRRIMTGKPFIRALLPHLTGLREKPSLERIYMSVYRRL